MVYLLNTNLPDASTGYIYYLFLFGLSCLLVVGVWKNDNMKKLYAISFVGFMLFMIAGVTCEGVNAPDYIRLPVNIVFILFGLLFGCLSIYGLILMAWDINDFKNKNL